MKLRNNSESNQTIGVVIFPFLVLLLLLDIFVYTTINNYINLHDIVILIFLLYLTLSKQTILFDTKVYRSMVLYFGYAIALSVALILFQTRLTYITFFYILKEFIYILSLFLISNSFKLARNLTNYLFYSLMFLTVVYGSVNLISTNVIYYGLGSIVNNLPSISGTVYFSCFVLFFSSNQLPRKYLAFFSIICVILTFATISRTSILGLTIFLLVYFLMTLLHTKVKIKTLFTIVLFSFLVLAIILITDIFGLRSIYLFRFLIRIGSIIDAISIRLGMSKEYFAQILGNSLLGFAFGAGKGIPEIVFGRGSLGVDNQYSRLIIEVGILGAILFFNMIYNFLKYVFYRVDLKGKKIIFGLALSYLGMGFGYEIFQVTKSGILFWVLLAWILIQNELKVEKMT